jgi:N-acyl-D-amino-acid deacylase
MARGDVLLLGGMVVDGTGSPARRADVAVQGDRIAAVGALAGRPADTVLDVTGLVVAPGFIDMHSHSDLALLANPRAESKLRQGVTTEVIGQCGFSPAPAPAARRAEIRALFAEWSPEFEVEWAWESLGEYLQAWRASPASVNVVPVVGHGTVRAAVMGGEQRPPTPAELTRMRAAVREAMRQGARGLSTGLAYAPSMFAEAAEIGALAREAARLGGVYFTHLRDESDGLLQALGEALDIGRRADVPVQISHLKCGGRRNHGRAAEALGLIDQARAEGVAVSFDAYPYTAWNTTLLQLLPPWARDAGVERAVSWLGDPGRRARIERELAAAAGAEPGMWEQRLVAAVGANGNRGLQGLTLAQAAARLRLRPEQVVTKLLAEEQGRVSMVGFGMSEEDVRTIVAHPGCMIGSDAVTAAPYGPLGQSHPHPRGYGTFPRVLGHYVREERVLALEAAVAKMTGGPARKLGLADRGRVAAGMAADLVVFDPARIADRASYEKPHQYPAGVHYVIVNGVIELRGETHCDRRPGRVLARPAG